MNQVWKWFLILSGGIILIWSALPLFSRIAHTGVLLPMAIGIFLICYGVFEERIFSRKTKRYKSKYLVRGTIVGCFGIFFMMSAILSLGFSKVQANPSELQDQTVVILGCKIEGDQPSKMLKNRLETAAKLLEKNPELPCIVSGGQGEDEQWTECKVMKDYLIEYGISPDRIYEESEAKNTQENLLFSKKLIQEKGLPDKVIIVTDFYHQYRANLYAQKVGLVSQGYSCQTEPKLFFSYWCREMIAVIKEWILG